jgi:hypothetical protein
MKNYLEHEIDKLLDYINNQNKGFGWKNHPNRNHNGVYLQGEPFDYVIFTIKNKICFDAKMVKGNIWVIEEKDIKQAINLQKVYNTNGIDCFFLILFNKSLKQIKINRFFEILKYKKSININDCNNFNYKELF